MPKDTREKVTLSPEAYKALEVEAMLHGSSLKDTASKLILKAACPKCKEILDIMARPVKEHKDLPPQEPNVIIDQGIDIMQPDTITQEHKGTTIDLKSTSGKGHKGTSAQVPKGPLAQGDKGTKAKRKKLSEDPIALAKIEELLETSPRPTYAAIAKTVGYPRTTVNDAIKRIKEGSGQTK